MLFAAERAQMNVARDGAREMFEASGDRPKVLSQRNVSTFFGELRYAFRLVLEEKEILLFAAGQWIVIGLAYAIWTEVLDWIPDSVWQEASNADSEITFTFINMVLLGWSFLVVAVASYPISILNAAMTAAHYLRSSGQRSTVARCINLAFKNLGRLWAFTTIDAWITVNAILDRLPRKRGNRTPLDEALYYAWKIGTIGVVPALVADKGFVEAAQDSLTVLKTKPVRAIGIRMGYSLICWIVGVGAYVGAIAYFIGYGDHIGENKVYEFYLFMALPIVVAVGITAVVVRPFYLVLVSKLYTDIVTIDRKASAPSAGARIDAIAAIFSVLLVVLLAAYFFGDQLGIRDWVERLGARDLSGS